MNRNRFLSVWILVMLALFMSACGYWKGPVGSNEVGLRMHDGTSIDEVVGPGRYTDMGWYARLVRVNVSSQTIEWSDPDLVTKDKQPIGLSLAVTYKRMSDAFSIQNSWQQYNAATGNDEELQKLVLTRIPRIAKEITTQFSLDEMLGVNEGQEAGRGVVTARMFELLADELEEINVTLIDVGINNIAPSATYLSLIEEKANSQVAIEVARAKKVELDEQLEAEQAQTNIELELARRANLVAQEEALAFEQSDRAYELRRLELMADIFGPNDKVFFVPQGSDITLLVGSAGVAAPLSDPSEQR